MRFWWGRGRGGFVTIVHTHITSGGPKIVRQYISLHFMGTNAWLGKGETNLIQKINSQFCTTYLDLIPYKVLLQN